METALPGGYSAKTPMLAGTGPLSEWGINSTCGAFWSGKRNNEFFALRSTTFLLCSGERAGVLGGLRGLSRPSARKGAQAAPGDSPGTAKDSEVPSLVDSSWERPGAQEAGWGLRGKGAGEGPWTGLSSLMSGRPAGGEDVILANLVAVSGMDVSNKTPESLCIAPVFVPG